MRGNRAKRALQGHLLLEKNGFAAPKVVLQKKNYLVMECITPEVPLSQFLKDTVDKKEAIRQLAETIGRLHACNICHGDLRWGNVLVRGEEFLFLDNERTVQYRRLPARKRLKNLVQLNLIPEEGLVSREDKKLFFELYAAHNPEVLHSKEEWIEKIKRKTEYRLAKMQK